ncbi:hypothetical protein BJ878DRAFT_477351 [Calycina marina]|uniref:Uncharacterized protein n=1 Tax=Calycina marina TaxID=1763456 RepID=A0A9P8CHP1_9HELO|nr:hypothetical protein BJ878DRAFT_477351 [Calycina marina]
MRLLALYAGLRAGLLYANHVRCLDSIPVTKYSEANVQVATSGSRVAANLAYACQLPAPLKTVVLALFSFKIPMATIAGRQEHQSVVQNFLEACRAPGRTKLVINLNVSPRGDPYLAAEIFNQFFRKLDPYHTARMRATDELNFLGSALTAIPYDSFTYAIINYPVLLTANETSFPSWPALLDPISLNGDNFTSLFHNKCSDPIQTLQVDGIAVTGYLSRTQKLTQPFTEDNIILIYHGNYGSACAQFSELTRVQTSVRSVIFRRPSTTRTNAKLKRRQRFQQDRLL